MKMKIINKATRIAIIWVSFKYYDIRLAFFFDCFLMYERTIKPIQSRSPIADKTRPIIANMNSGFRRLGPTLETCFRLSKPLFVEHIVLVPTFGRDI